MSYDPATYVEGVPVKISEKYRPPRKVTLSTLCSYQVNTDVLTTEYDLTTETETLKWLQNIKNYKDNRIKIRKEKIRMYDEEKEETRKLLEQKLEEERLKREEEEERLQREAEETQANELSNADPEKNEEGDINADVNNSEEKETDELGVAPENNDHENDVDKENEANKLDLKTREANLTHNAQLSQPSNGEVGYNNPQAISSPLNSQQASQSPMLVPTQCIPQTHHKSPTKAGYNINFADFEGDGTDPFDSVSLKSINDMEELAKILQTSNIKQQKVYAPNNLGYNYHHPGVYMNGGYTYNPYSYMNYPQSNPPVTNPSHYNQISSYQSKVSSPPSNTSVPMAGKSNSMFQHEDFSANNYPQWNQLTDSSNTGQSDALPQYKPYNYGMSQTIMPSNSNKGVPVDSSFNNMGAMYPSVTSTHIVGSPLTGNSMQPQSSGLDAVNKRQDLEDFYSRYYSNKKSSSGVRSGDSTPTSQLQNTKTLTSSSSVPDLTVVEDNEVSDIISSNNIENVDFLRSNTTTPPRPCSTSGYESNNRSDQMTKGSSPNLLKSRLSDPFTELNEEAQILVQGIAEMGFPRPRVARAVQKLGTDHKKLLEVLLTLQSFQEKGEDEYMSERAFYFFMGQVDKVNEFLLAAKTLLDLGFEGEKVMEQLFKNGNDKEKCLEELIALNL